MRQKFETDLTTFNEIAKEELKPVEERDESFDLDQVLNFHFKKAAERQHTPNIDVQKQIYAMQKEKQDVMLWLEEKLRGLDDTGYQGEKNDGYRDLEYNETKKLFKYSTDNGNKYFATAGQILTDMDWGVKYNMTASVPRQVAKRYFVRQARKKLEELLDKQIVESEIGSTSVDSFKKGAYKIIQTENSSGQHNERTGIISEVIVKNFLEKACADHGLPFRVKDTDVFEDVEHKIDLVIEVDNRSRGVDVEESQEAKEVSVSQKNYGIQFSTNPDAEYHKMQQIKRAKGLIRGEQNAERGNARHKHAVDDIFLVIFPLGIARDMRENWKKTGKVAGGPSSFMYQPTAELLLKGLLKDIFTESEIDGFWQKIKLDFPELPQQMTG